MSCIALSIATEGLARPVLAMSGCTSLLHGSPETSCCGTSIPRFSTRLSSGIAKGEPGRARRHGGLLLSRTPSPKPVWVPFPESSPWRLGAAIPRVRPG